MSTVVALDNRHRNVECEVPQLSLFTLPSHDIDTPRISEPGVETSKTGLIEQTIISTGGRVAALSARERTKAPSLKLEIMLSAYSALGKGAVIEFTALKGEFSDKFLQTMGAVAKRFAAEFTQGTDSNLGEVLFGISKIREEIESRSGYSPLSAWLDSHCSQFKVISPNLLIASADIPSLATMIAATVYPFVLRTSSGVKDSEPTLELFVPKKVLERSCSFLNSLVHTIESKLPQAAPSFSHTQDPLEQIPEPKLWKATPKAITPRPSTQRQPILVAASAPTPQPTPIERDSKPFESERILQLMEKLRLSGQIV